MGEKGKRSRAHGDDSGSKNQKRRSDRGRGDKEERSNGEQVLYRILCPDHVIGSVIGKNGKVINAIRQESRAKVKVIDPFPGAKDRVLMIYCHVKEKKADIDVDKEFTDVEPLCPAQDALLKVHAAIADAVAAAAGDKDSKRDREKVECLILVPTSQSAYVIGKLGASVKKLRHWTKANIKVTAKNAGDPFHSCAFGFDNFVLISGDSEAVKKALFAISAIMYKFTPKENIPFDTSVAADAPPSIIIPSDLPVFPMAGLYPGVNPVVPHRPVQSMLGHSHTSNIAGYADPGISWPLYSSDLPVVSGYSGKQAQELMLKVLCPASKIGRVIGKGGNCIKSIRQDSGAHVDVEDPKSNHNERVIQVISTESLDDMKSKAVEAVLLLQSKMNGEGEENFTFRLLVPSKVIGCIIGRSGSIVNEIRKRTKADIRISKSDRPSFAHEDEELVEVSGEVGSVRDALIQIVLRLRDDVLTYREGVRNSSAATESLYSGGASLHVPTVLPSMSPGAALGHERRTESRNESGLFSSYGYESLSMPDNLYRSLPSHSASIYGGLPPPSVVEMIIPAHAAGRVLGKGGSNIENIRKISGAVVEISDAKYSRGERVAIISGTSDQKRSAESLIQAFIMAT